jgi:hypothetical protein
MSRKVIFSMHEQAAPVIRGLGICGFDNARNTKQGITTSKLGGNLLSRPKYPVLLDKPVSEFFS